MLNIGQRVAITKTSLKGYTGKIIDIDTPPSGNIYWVKLDIDGSVTDLLSNELTTQF